MRYAHVASAVILNVVECDDVFALDNDLVLVEGLSPEPGLGWTSVASQWQPPVVPASVQNEQTLQQRAINALAMNASYLADGTITNADVVNQVNLLTRECSGIIRLLLGQLDSTSGT